MSAAVDEVASNTASASEAAQASNDATQSGHQCLVQTIKSIHSLRDLASHSAEGASQTAVASHELSQLAEGLDSVVMRFKLH